METSEILNLESISKPWGAATFLDVGPYHEVLCIFVKPGGFCSKHEHATKINKFCVLSGILRVRWWIGDQIKCSVLGPGEAITIPAGGPHQFEAEKETNAIEVYFPRFAAAERDIIRWEMGGLNE